MQMPVNKTSDSVKHFQCAFVEPFSKFKFEVNKFTTFLNLKWRKTNRVASRR